MECSPKPISEDPFGKSVRTDWPIDFGYAFLNHGSFGSVPVCVHEHAEAWRSTFESRPIEWFGRKCPEVVRVEAVDDVLRQYLLLLHPVPLVHDEL